MSGEEPAHKRRRITHDRVLNCNTNNVNQSEQMNNMHLQRIKQHSDRWHNYIKYHLPPLLSVNFSGSAAVPPCINVNNPYTKMCELEKQNEALQKKQIKMDEMLRKLTLENNKLKICVRALSQIVKEGPKPQKHLVPMSKTEPWSKEVDKIKQKLNKYFQRRYKCLEIDIEPAKHQSDNVWIADNALRKRIENHITVNGINNSETKDNSQILIEKCINQNHATTIIDEFQINECFKMNLFDYIEAFKIKKGHRIKALEGKIGLRAKRFVPKGTVLGQYIGTEYLGKEFDTIYEHSNEWNLRNMYAFDLNLYIPADIDDTQSTTINPQYYQTATKKEFIVDGFGQKKLNPLIYINDCRQNIEVENPTKEDEQYWNCSFRTIVINGWPAVFVLTKKDVYMGQAFNIYYGDNYGVSITQMNRHQLLMDRLRSLVDDNILKMLNIDNDIPDVYILDM